ncbi:MAG TPA: hypothetical protein VMU83_18945 [Hanamia sp.]|nr:hypothetical protein [Hanamia sp.]
METIENTLKKLSMAIGSGLIAGFDGTIAMTISQKIEMKITGRKSSNSPAKAAREVFDIKPVTEAMSGKVSDEIHLVYGTSLGMVRGALSLIGLKGLQASFIHLATVWGGEMIILPTLKVAPPITKQKPGDIATQGLHQLVYAVTTGLVFDAINK